MGRTTSSTFGLTLAALLGACQSLPTYPINARPRKLAIGEGDKVPLEVALVISEPMACRLFLDRRIARPSGETFRSSSRELSGAEGTDQYYPLRREFARVAEATFRQVFTGVVPLKQLPPRTPRRRRPDRSPGGPHHGSCRIRRQAGRTHADVVLTWRLRFSTART